jgi:hypothetical protein
MLNFSIFGVFSKILTDVIYGKKNKSTRIVVLGGYFLTG